MPKRVLVVDNDWFYVELVGDIVKQEGYEVSKAYDGIEAMEALKGELPDIVILDMVMPRIDGDRVFQYIRGNPRTGRLPVIILSGTLVEDQDALVALGANAYVAKGRRDDMQRNIQAALQSVEAGPSGQGPPIIGVEGLLPREKVRELLALRRYTETVLSTLIEGVLEVDRCRRVVSVNRAGTEILGCAEMELLGTRLTDLLGPDNRGILEDAIAGIVARPADATEAITLRHRDRVLRLTLACVVGGDPTANLFVNLQDVTDLARKIDELSALNARLQALDQTRSELLTMISHDLHTPLTAIKGSLDVLLHENVGVELGRELLGIAQKNTDRLFRLVSDILDLARIEAGRFQERREPFDILVCMRGAIDRLHHLAQAKEVAITLAAPDQVSLVVADPLRMEQVCTNLLGNALKFTPRGGRIQVAVQERADDLLVVVQDTGLGIPPEYQGRVFDRFYRVPVPAGTEVDGTGLGLTICKVVIEEHEGRIWLESAVGQGTTVSFTIPKRQPEIRPAP
jgi:two-component system phosphate regulon sensor histidine kinase PhoR